MEFQPWPEKKPQRILYLSNSIQLTVGHFWAKYTENLPVGMRNGEGRGIQRKDCGLWHSTEWKNPRGGAGCQGGVSHPLRSRKSPQSRGSLLHRAVLRIRCEHLPHGKALILGYQSYSPTLTFQWTFSLLLYYPFTKWIFPVRGIKRM